MGKLTKISPQYEVLLTQLIEGSTMFPFWDNLCCSNEPSSRRTYQERKLKFLKGMRDDLEARVAGLNAAIETIERQLSRDDSSTAS
jgi:hypothetical protein